MSESFLRLISKLAEGTEIPGLFAIWSGLAGLSCALGRRVWIDMRTYTIFPNMYIVLVAASGRCRKSASINLIEKLLYQLTPVPNLISQKITTEGLIDALHVIQVNDDKQFLKESRVGFVIADELQTFLNRRSYETELGTILIPLYDCKDHFSYRTRGRGVEITDESCLGILAGTTPTGLKEVLPIQAIGEGLTSRIIFAYCATPSKPVAITRRTKELDKIEEESVKFLQQVLTLEGPISLTKEAWEYYEELYNDFYATTPFYDLSTLSGYASRRHCHLLKLATLFAVSNRLSISIEKKDIESANEFLSMSETTMPMLLNLITSTEIGILTQEVYDLIKSRKRISRKNLLALVVHRMDDKAFSNICETLIRCGKITITVEGSDLIFGLVK